MEKIDFINGTSPYISGPNLNAMQNNSELNKYDFQFPESGEADVTTSIELTLPAYYKKGVGVLQVYLEGCLLNEDNYNEGDIAGTVLDGDITNIITLTEWGNLTQTYNLSCVIQGYYEALTVNTATTESEANMNE